MDFDTLIRINLPEGFTYGYIGNCGPGFDDRGWTIFGPPRRIWSSNDRPRYTPTYSTENRYLIFRDFWALLEGLR